MVSNDSTGPDLHLQTPKSSSDTINLSVADVFEFVKQNNARFERDSKYPTKFTPNPTSAVVNDDSTPKVMYHGTGSEFWGFDKSKANAMTGRRMGLGAGKGEFYLTEHKGSANAAAYVVSDGVPTGVI